MERQRKSLKKVRGVVLSRSGEKSIRVVRDYKVKHPIYGKYISRRTKFGVHDERNEAGVGDVVDIIECRPISKNKSWRLLEVIEKAVIE